MTLNSVSVILNVYKRHYTLRDQIDAIFNQTVKVKPEDIHIWFNNTGKPTTEDELFFTEHKIKYYVSSHNTKFFGRFMIPLLCQTEYVALFDDDIIPGKKWLENCIKNIQKCDGILGGSGVITNGHTYTPNTKIGWNGETLDHPAEVDLVGHAWFFKQKYANLMWLEPIPSWENGEDIFLAYMAQKHGLQSYVPEHPDDDIEMWSNVPYRSSTNGQQWGNDQNATYLTKNNHTPIRNMLVANLKSRGWKLLKG